MTVEGGTEVAVKSAVVVFPGAPRVVVPVKPEVTVSKLKGTDVRFIVVLVLSGLPVVLHPSVLEGKRTESPRLCVGL